MTLTDYLNTRYRKGGRGPTYYDCWGMTRAAFHSLFGGEMLPTCADALPGSISAITKSVRNVAREHAMTPQTQVRPGMIATCWHGRACVHVGLVVEADGRLWVLETDDPIGPVLTRVAEFEDRYSQVVYYAH